MPKIYCKKCQKALTEELEEIDTKFLFHNVSNVGDFSGDFIPAGKVFYNTGKITPKHKNTWLSGLENSYQIRNHNDIRRLTSSCCFFDGEAGINSICFKNHEVATRINDCFMMNYIAWDSEKTELK